MRADLSRSERPLLVVGMPRSGTTWAMQVLETAGTVHCVLEPDNEGTSAPAVWAKRHSGRFPALWPGDRDDSYRALWAWAFGGAPRGPRQRLAAQLMKGVQPPARTRHLQGKTVPLLQLAGLVASRPHVPANHHPPARTLVKSVHAPLAVEWLADEFDVEVVVLLRHPGNVLASWLKLDLNERYVDLASNPAVRAHLVERWGIPGPGRDPLEQVVWEIGVLICALEEAASRHPEWTVRTHEELCADPRDAFGKLFAQLDLPWRPAADEYLAGHDRPGEGFHTQRVAAELPDAWTRSLTPDQIATLQRVLRPFPLGSWDVEGFGPPAGSGQREGESAR